MLISYAGYTDIGGRPYNEDTADFGRLDEESLCAVLADGLGGHGGGQTASKEAVKTILKGCKRGMTPVQLSELVQEAHRKVLEHQTRECRMKTTAVVLLVESGQAQWAHVGDSRLYHFADGKVVFQTRDHSISQMAVMMGQITADQIRFHEDRNRVFRALGQEEGVNVDLGEQKLVPGKHAFLLCTDGFWEYVYEAEMEQELSKAVSPQDWLERMRQHLQNRAGSDNDNNTALAVWLTI